MCDQGGLNRRTQLWYQVRRPHLASQTRKHRWYRRSECVFYQVPTFKMKFFFYSKTLEYFIISGQLFFKVVLNLNTENFPTLGTGGRQKLFCHVLGREREMTSLYDNKVKKLFLHLVYLGWVWHSSAPWFSEWSDSFDYLVNQNQFVSVWQSETEFLSDERECFAVILYSTLHCAISFANNKRKKYFVRWTLHINSNISEIHIKISQMQ
jgi:hypothetical protein